MSASVKNNHDIEDGNLVQDDHDITNSSNIMEGDLDHKNHQDELMGRLRDNLKKQDQSRKVRVLRVVVILVLLAAATIVSTGLCVYATRKERETFEDTFATNANLILEAFGDGLTRKLVALGSMAAMITSQAVGNNDVEFPFVTVPNFAILGDNFRVQADSAILHWAPLVTDEKRPAWEEYALQNRFQVDEAFLQDKTYRNTQDQFLDQGNRRRLQEYTLEPTEVQVGNETIQVINNTLQDGSKFHPRICDPNPYTPRPLNSGPFFPRWQRSPINAAKQNTVNIDLTYAGIIADAVQKMLEQPSIVVGEPYLVEEGSNWFKNLMLSQYRDTAKMYAGEPLSYMVHPVFDSFYNATASVEEHQQHLAGLMYTNIYWRQLLRNILAPSISGVIVVIENSYNDTHAYQIDGPSPTYLGNQDPIELYQDYEHMGLFLDATPYVQERAQKETTAYTTVPLHPTHGLYQLRIYPSKETEEIFTSKQPIIFTVAVAAVFLVTALVFIIFNNYVERRQRFLMNKALQSGALVSSLFPEQVQKRLYQDDAAENKNKKDQPKAWTIAKNPGNVDEEDNRTNEIGTSPPIADLYSAATVMFADVSGFTAWSSSRTPSDVFHLLESLYSAFDLLATKRGVFKVETIGDSWLGVCGLPEPNPQHAVIMAKFANDCLVKMNQLVQKLSERLGTGTEALELRIGLHSGCVTAGVLRGQKSRFQLFGDTVNTASRIETTGVPGRIHASEETAKELIANGRGNWLIEREDKVTAKGKGDLQTYFVHPHANTKSVSGKSSSVVSGKSSSVVTPSVDDAVEETNNEPSAIFSIDEATGLTTAEV